MPPPFFASNSHRPESVSFAGSCGKWNYFFA